MTATTCTSVPFGFRPAPNSSIREGLDAMLAFMWTVGLPRETAEKLGAIVDGTASRCDGLPLSWPGDVDCAAPLPVTVTTETYSSDGWGEMSDDFGGCAD